MDAVRVCHTLHALKQETGPLKQTNKQTNTTHKSKHQKKPRDVASSWSPAPRPTPLISRSHPPPSPLGRHATFLLPSGTKGDPGSLEATIRSAWTKSRSPSHPNASSERSKDPTCGPHVGSWRWSTCLPVVPTRAAAAKARWPKALQVRSDSP